MNKCVKCMVQIVLLLSFIMIVVRPHPVLACNLQGTPYVYTNDGDCSSPDNKIKLQLSKNYIKISASVMWKKDKYMLDFSKQFKMDSKVKKYECVSHSSYMGKVSRKTFVEDMKLVHAHEWGGCIFYVKKGKIIGYELCG